MPVESQVPNTIRPFIVLLYSTVLWWGGGGVHVNHSNSFSLNDKYILVGGTD